MRKSKLKLFSLFIVSVIIFSSLTLSIFAASKNDSEIDLDFSKHAKAVYLYSLDAQRTLYSSGQDKIMHVGPVAKIMTGIIACETLSDKLEQSVTISAEMLSGVWGNSMQLKAGMTLTVKDLLYGTICGGNNDAAQALAFVCSESTTDFVSKMNSYAKRLGMDKTEFSNATGLDDTESKTTISDTALLVKEAVKNSLYMEISSTPSYILSNGTTIYNRNALLSQFNAQGYINKNANGIIAGSTTKGGFMVATLAQKNDLSYICIVMGADTDSQHVYSYQIANTLIDYAIKNFQYKQVATKDQVVHSVNVTSALKEENAAKTKCVIPNDIFALVPKNTDLNEDIKYRVFLHDDENSAPIEKNTVIGVMHIYCKDVLIAESPVIIAENVEVNTILSTLDNMKAFFSSRFFIIFLIVFIPSLLTYISASSKFRRKKAQTIKYKKFH